MKISKTSLAIFTVILGLAGAVATKAASLKEKVRLYYQLPGQPVSSTLTVTCTAALANCTILVKGIPVTLYRDAAKQQPVKATSNKPKSIH